MTSGSPVVQSKTITGGHVASWTTDGVIQDGGTAALGAVTELGVTKNGGLGVAISTANPPNAYVQFGLGVASSGVATVYANSYGGAPSASLQFNINGSVYPFNPSGGGNITGPNSAVSGDLVSFNGTGGNLVQDAGVRSYAVPQGYFNVAAFGADLTGSSDSTTAVLAAITACQAAGGGVVWFPPGNVKIASGTLAVTVGKVTFAGAGRMTSSITFANGALDCITAIGPSYAGALYGFTVQDLSLLTSSKTGGRLIVAAYFAQVVIRNIYATCWTGIELWVNNTVWIENVQINTVSGGANIPASYYGSYAPGACYGLWWHAPGDNSARSDLLYTNGLLVQAANSGAYGFIWDGLANTWSSNNDAVLGAVYGLLVLNSAVSTTYYPIFGEFNNFTTESITSQAVRILAGQQIQFVNSDLTNVADLYGFTDTNAVYIGADSTGSRTNLIQFTNSRIGLSSGAALYVLGRDVQASNCTFVGGAGLPANTYPAVRIGAGAQDVQITGCKFSSWAQPFTWKNGLLVEAGTFRIQATGNTFYGSGTRSIQWNNADNGSGTDGNISVTNPAMPAPAQLSVTTGATLAGTYFLNGVTALNGPGSNWTQVTDTAANIVAASPNPKTYATIQLQLINVTAYQMTLQPGSGVTFSGRTNSGNFVVPTAQSILLTVELTNTAAGSEAVNIFGATLA